MSHAYSNIRRAILALTLLLTISISQGFAQWVEAPSLSQARNLAMTTIMDGKLYIWGGVTAPFSIGNFYPRTLPVATGQLLTLPNGPSWTSLAPLTQIRSGGFAAPINGKIYIVGGTTVEGSSLNIASSVLKYDPSTQLFSQLPDPMPTPLWGSAYAVVGTKIYLFGGMSATQNGYTLSDLVQVFDASTESWTTLSTRVPYPMAYAAATPIGQKFMLVGGVTVQSGGLAFSKAANMGTINPSGITWSAVANYPEFVSVAAAGTLNGKAYIAGGEGPNGVYASVYRFDENGNKWDPWYMLPTPISGVQVMPSDGTSLYLVSGGDSKKVLRLQDGNPVAVAQVPQTEFYVTTQVGETKSLSIPIRNIGVAELEGSVNIPTEAQSWLSTSSGSFNDIMAGATGNLNLTLGGAAVAAGNYKATVTINTNDPNKPSIPVTVRFFVRESITTQDAKIVIEESSGAWCGPCGAYGVPLMRQLSNTYQDELITIVYHHRGGGGVDPMATTEIESMAEHLEVPFFPAATFQRWRFPGESNLMVGTDLWTPAAALVKAVQPTAPASIELTEYSYDQLDNRVTAKLNIKTSQGMPWTANSSLRVTAVVIEDSVAGTQNGQNENPFYHMHVARSIWPNNLGQNIPISAESLHEDGAVLLPNTSGTVDVSFQPKNVAAARRSHVVFLVHVNYGDRPGPVLQGMEFPLTGSVGGTSGFALEAGTTSKAVTPGQQATFEPVVRNNGTSPLLITATRVSADYPEDNWSSRICVADDCADPSQNTKSTTVLPGQTKTFRLLVTTGSSGQGKVMLRFSDGNDNEFEQEFIVTSQGSGVDINPVAGNGLRLMQNSPNPASSVTRFGYTLPSASNVNVDVFSVTGEKVLAISKGLVESGDNSLDLDVSSLTSGIYTVRLTANGTSVSRTISVTR